MATMPLPPPPRGLTSVALRAFRRLRGHNPAADLDLTAGEASKHVFCFAGEFGYEVISWLPYLLDLKRHVDFRLVTYGRPGSKVFYNFSDEHHEFGVGIVGSMWGDLATYAALQASRGGTPIVFPRAKRNILVEGRPWRTRDIHTDIPNDEYYELLDYSAVRLPSAFRFERPFVVINNKFTAEWGGPPTNFFSREELIALRDFLIRRGYAIVYNHFREKSRTRELGFDLDDSGIFGASEHTFDLSDEYRKTDDIDARNRLQLSTYNQAVFVIAPQGGSCYLPAICRRDLVMLMRIGDYIDYRELSRVYGVQVDVFYEVPHMLAWLAQHLDARRA
jgi:hypothetical protein